MMSEQSEKTMPLLEHLVELRRRLLYSVVVFLLLMGGCFYFAQNIFDFLAKPLANILLQQTGRRFIFTDLTEFLFTQIKVSFFTAFSIAFPLFAHQLWKFIAPGLYKQERLVLLPFLMASPILFMAGAALLYYVLLPYGWEFLLSFQTAGGQGTLAVEFEGKVSEYVGLIMKLIFAFGICFQLPVLLILLVRARILTAQALAKKRRHAIVLVFIVAAVVTPPDPFSQVALALPLVILYEVSIWCARLIERKRKQGKKDADDAPKS